VTTTPLRVLTADHRRALATVVATGGPVYIATSFASAQDPSRMALWPANVPFVTSAATDLWVQAQTGSLSLGVVTELWAAGDGTA
jgi:hypothetical protein